MNRYGHLDDSGEEIKIEINLQKVRVLTVPDWDEHSETEVIQFSKHDTVNNLHSRFKNEDRYESFKLLKVNCHNELIQNVINKYKDFYKNGGEFNYRISKIIPSDECVMCLALDDQSLLIAEHIQSYEGNITFLQKI